MRIPPHRWRQDRPGNLADPDARGFLQQLEFHEADKLLIDLDALLHQDMGYRLGRGVQAQAVKGVPDRSFLAGGAHVVILLTAWPTCLLPSLLLRRAGFTLR